MLKSTFYYFVLPYASVSEIVVYDKVGDQRDSHLEHPEVKRCHTRNYDKVCPRGTHEIKEGLTTPRLNDFNIGPTAL
jgi:hypothetical protein